MLLIVTFANPFKIRFANGASNYLYIMQENFSLIIPKYLYMIKVGISYFPTFIEMEV
ncbi:hypothetical protein BRYFOR_08350 [Marvinbryantia formatexigens DSM 14469]|uniref:Uncharacterized protein n=1 Tax=Marvinbryantia formatexigens DSM 14469 TaxID=478749 RepID=C6LI79_9FIRM|nr:hypothetical protein BRYFOR_08350 [Marvinbryantia formatexigens DSM 14469]